jgi:hypothetical protein
VLTQFFDTRRKARNHLAESEVAVVARLLLDPEDGAVRPSETSVPLHKSAKRNISKNNNNRDI